MKILFLVVKYYIIGAVLIMGGLFILIFNWQQKARDISVIGKVVEVEYTSNRNIFFKVSFIDSIKGEQYYVSSIKSDDSLFRLNDKVSLCYNRNSDDIVENVLIDFGESDTIQKRDTYILGFIILLMGFFAVVSGIRNRVLP